MKRLQAKWQRRHGKLLWQSSFYTKAVASFRFHFRVEPPELSGRFGTTTAANNGPNETQVFLYMLWTIVEESNNWFDQFWCSDWFIGKTMALCFFQLRSSSLSHFISSLHLILKQIKRSFFKPGFVLICKHNYSFDDNNSKGMIWKVFLLVI